MKVLVVSTNQLKNPVPVVPIGAGMVYSSIQKHGYDVEFLDMMFLENPLEVLAERLKKFGPHVICLSIRNIDNQVYQKQEFYLPLLKQIMVVCKSLNAGKIIIGGAAMQVMPEEIMAYLDADYGICGYGEREIIQLLKSIEHDHFPKGASRLRTCGDFFDPLLSRLPPKGLFDKHYFLTESHIKKSIMGYQTSRGCIGRCIYCTMGCSSSEFCRISSEILWDDVERLTGEYGIEKVTFVDDIFNQDMESTMAICDSLIHWGKKLKWTCSLSPAVASEELICNMKRSGCTFVDLGIDSGCDRILENMRKGFQVEDILALGKMLDKYEIPYAVSLLFGGPGENALTVQEAIKTVNELNPVYVLAGVGIRVYPRTALFEVAVSEGRLKPEEDLLEPKFYQSQEFSIDMLKNALKYSRHTYKNMLMQIL